MKCLTLATVLAFWLLEAGCDRTHLSPSFGVAERHAFESQVIHPDAGGERKPEQPLDPEEAAVVARRYQRSLATTPHSGEPDPLRSPMLVVPSSTPGAAPPSELR